MLMLMTSPCGTCRVAEHGTVLEKPHPQSTIQLYGLTMVYGKVVRDITHITIIRAYGGWIHVSRFSIALGLALCAGVRPHVSAFHVVQPDPTFSSRGKGCLRARAPVIFKLKSNNISAILAWSMLDATELGSRLRSGRCGCPRRHLRVA